MIACVLTAFSLVEFSVKVMHVCWSHISLYDIDVHASFGIGTAIIGSGDGIIAIQIQLLSFLHELD